MTTRQRVDLRGPVAKRVARNIRWHRERRGWSLARLSEELAQVDHGILRSGVHKIETGTQRVDVDTLVAIALVLDVAPHELMFRATDDEHVVSVGSVMLTDAVSTTDEPVWAARSGAVPGGELDDQGAVVADLQALARIRNGAEAITDALRDLDERRASRAER